MLDKQSPVLQMAYSAWVGIRSRLSMRVLFPLTLLCLVISLIYIFAIYEPIPTSPDLCKLWNAETPRPNATLWWQYACLIEKDMDTKQGYQCRKMELMGNWRVCWDQKYAPRDDCIVYSFGINNDFSFDDAMAQRGCTVYSFDPSMGVEDHRHSERVYFKNLGLGHEDTDTFHPNFDGYVRHTSKWKMRSLKSIMKMLGHEKRVLDVVKLDIEVYEWDVILSIIRDGLFPQVRQFLVEWHIFPNEPSREKFKEYFDAYMSLRSHGLEFYYKGSGSRYHHYRYFNSQADMNYVNFKVKDES